MIQFNRVSSHRVDSEINRMISAMTTGISTRPYLVTETLLELGAKYPDNLRLAGIAARMARWAAVEWEDIDFMLPIVLPQNFAYKQELVACAGFERANRKWGIEEDEWYLLCGFAPRVITPGGRVIHGHVVHQPKGGTVFEVLEELVNTAIYAEMQGYSLKVELTGGWWKYEEPFEEIFADLFEFCSGKLPRSLMDGARTELLKGSDAMMEEFACLKEGWYNEIAVAINDAVSFPFNLESDVGIMYLRGGDALRTQTVLPPAGLIWRELTYMSRFVRRRMIMSDDLSLGAMIHTGDPWVQDRSSQGISTSALPEMQQFLDMYEAKLNWSCPTAPIVNAAQWSRVDRDNYSLINPVFRYLVL